MYLLLPAALVCVAFASPEVLPPLLAALRLASVVRPAAAVVEIEPSPVALSVESSARRAE